MIVSITGATETFLVTPPHYLLDIEQETQLEPDMFWQLVLELLASEYGCILRSLTFKAFLEGRGWKSADGVGFSFSL